MLTHIDMTRIMPSAAPNMDSIQTRFGTIVVDPSKAIVFARGMLGMPDKSRFILTEFPSERMKQFTLLQSLDDHALSFITLPLAMSNAIIAQEDIKAACAELRVSMDNALVLLVVSVHRSPGGMKLSVNARAPIIVDSDKQTGEQMVLQNDAYKVQHMLG